VFPAASWPGLKGEFDEDYMRMLCHFLRAEYKDWEVYPSRRDIFNALHLTPFEKVRVVIVGEDPYRNAKHAMGLAFSVPRGVRPLPRSLDNIHRELDGNPALERDPDTKRRKSGDLTWWAEQDVLLLNSVLTRGEAGSHAARGWELFTDKAIELLIEHQKRIEHPKRLVFLLLGKEAKKKARLVDRSSHHILCADHPAARGDNFIGCGHFSQTNTFLKKQGLPPIQW